MPPSREDWALAIARRFFTPQTKNKTVRLDVDELILRKISDEENWNLPDPLSSLAQTIPSVSSGNLFIGRRFNKKASFLDKPGSPYDGLPIGIADFALGMVVANKRFVAQRGWSSDFNRYVGKVGSDTIFSNSDTSENLRRFLHHLSAWTSTADMGNIPPLPPHNCPLGICWCVWGPYGYIGKFYDHLETTQADKKTILDWIKYTMKQNPSIEFEDLIDEKALLNGQLYRFEKGFEVRLRNWLNSGAKALRTKFWEIIDNYLEHLIKLRNNRIRASRKNSNQSNSTLEKEEIDTIDEFSKSSKVRPLISITNLFFGGKSTKKLLYDLDEFVINDSISIDGKVVQLPLYDLDASSAIKNSEIIIDGDNFLQNKSGIFPFCILLEEDMVYKSKHMLQEPEFANTSEGDEFQIVCFGSGSLATVRDLLKRFATNPNVAEEIILQANQTLPAPQSTSDPDYLKYHRNSVFFFENLIRNNQPITIGDPSQLRLSGKSNTRLSGIRHAPRSTIFHKFGGNPSAVFLPGAGYTKSGLQQHIDLGNNSFKATQEIVNTNTNQSEVMEVIYESRQIKKNEMEENNSLVRNQYGEFMTSPTQIVNHQILSTYISKNGDACLNIQSLTKEHSERIFLNEDPSLPKIVDAQDRFSENSSNRKLWEEKLKNAIPGSNIDEISALKSKKIPPHLQSLIIDRAKEELTQGKVPKSGLVGLLGLEKVNVPISQDIINIHLKLIPNDQYYRKITDEMEGLGTGNQTRFLPSILLKGPPPKTSDEVISKLALLTKSGKDTPDNIDQTLENIISEKPWINDADGRIYSLTKKHGSKKLQTQYELHLAWLNFYSEVLECIENCDAATVKNLDYRNFHRDIQIGTIWVRIAKDINPQTFIRWTDKDSAISLISTCKAQYERAPMHQDAKEKINKEFTKIQQKINWILAYRGP